MIERGFPAHYSNTNSPSGAFQRGEFGASKQSSCAVGLDGLREHSPANEDTPTRGGAASAAPFRPIADHADVIVERLIGALEEATIDEAARLAVEQTRERV